MKKSIRDRKGEDSWSELQCGVDKQIYGEMVWTYEDDVREEA